MITFTKNSIKLLLVFMVLTFLVVTFQFSRSIEAQGANTAACSADILGMPPWHYYLDKTGAPECNIIAPDGFLDGNIPWLVAAAILESMLVVATYLAVVFVLIGGYQILASSGSPEAVAGGRRKITAAIIGFIIAITGSAVVHFLLGELTSGSGVAGIPNVDADGGRSAVNTLLSLAYRIAAGLAVIYIAIAGIQFSTSGGDPAKVAKARNSVLYAAIGLVIVLFAVAIIAFIGGQL